MKQLLINIGEFLAVVALLDLLVVFLTMMQIANGTETPHIPFWDTQIRFVAGLIR